MGWFFAWFGPGVDETTSTPTVPTSPTTVVVTPTSTDPNVINHLDEALDRLCEQFKGE